MNDNEYRVKITAELNQALGAFDALNKKIEQTGNAAGRSMGRLGKGFDTLKTALAGLAVGAGFKAMFAQAIEAENAMRQLDARIKSTGDSAGVGRERLIALSQSLQKITTSSDETILSAETLLLSFRRVRGPAFERTLKAALDLSQGLQRDLQSSILIVGKALQSPIDGFAALQKASIKFTAAQQDQIRALVESGRLQEAQGVILAELEKRFGGAAEAAGNTFGGALKQLKNAAGDLLEGDGSGLKGATAAVKELTATLNDPQVKEGFAVLVSGLVKVAEIAARSAAGVGGLIEHLRNLAILKTGGAINPDADDVERQRLFNSLLSDKLELDRKIAEIEANPISRTIGALSLKNLKKQRDAVIDLMRAEQDAEKARAIASQNAALDNRLRNGANSVVAGILGDPGAAAAAAEARDEALRAKRAAAAKAAEDARKRALADLERQFQSDEKRRFDSMVKDETTLADARLQLLKDSGQTLQAALAELQAKYGNTIDRMLQRGDTAGVALMRKLFNVEAAKAQLDELQKQVDRVFADQARQESSIRAQQAAGLIGELTARQQIVDLYRATAEQADGLIPKMRDLAAAINNPQAIDHVKDLQAQVQNLRISADETAQAIRASFEQGLGSAIDSLVDGTAKLQDAVRAFFAEIVRGIAQLATQRFVAGLFGAGGSGAGIVGALAGLFGGGKAEGGAIRGPGTGTSDSVLIAASSGEYVQRTAAVRHYGLAFMEAVNSLRFPRFATGGPVVALSAPLAAASAPRWQFADGGMVRAQGGQGAPAMAVRIVNVVDPQVALDAMASTAGERVILNAISRNARGVKQSLS